MMIMNDGMVSSWSLTNKYECREFLLGWIKENRQIILITKSPIRAMTDAWLKESLAKNSESMMPCSSYFKMLVDYQDYLVP